MARSEIFEHVLLLAATRLNAEAEANEAQGKEAVWAYGVSIAEDIEDRTGKPMSLGAVYRALDRLEDKGFVESWMGDPEGVSGGRAKKFYRVTKNGRRAVAETRKVFDAMWEGVGAILAEQGA
jgi:PadR family transcriptional regulator PadR